MFTRNYRLLAYFVEVVNHGSVRGAARKLFVSAPVVSKALADLEESLNTSLLIRGRRKLALTEDGEKVYAHALRMTHAAVDALSSINRADTSLQGHLDLNLSTELASTWLPSILLAFRERFPEVTIAVFASDQIEPEDQNRYHVVIRADYSLRSMISEQRYFAQLPLCVAYRPLLNPEGKRDIKRLLRDIPLIGFTQSTQSDHLNAVDSKTDRQVEFIGHNNIWVNNAQVIKEMVLQGYGAGLLIRYSVLDEIESGALCEMDPRYQFGYICLHTLFRDQYPSAAARAFHQFLMDLHASADFEPA